MSTFRIRTRLAPAGIVALSLEGDLDAHACDRFEWAVADLLDKNFLRIAVDLSPLTSMTGAGAGALLGSACSATEQGAEIVFTRPAPAIVRVLDLLGLKDMIPMAPHLAAALAHFQATAAPLAEAV